MRTVEIWSLLFSAIGIILSIGALIKAESAQKAVKNTIEKRNEDEDLQRLRNLISTLQNTKDAVKPWVPGISPDRQTGRQRDTDVATLMDAIDSLKTNAPLSLDAEKSARITETTEALEKHFGEITNPTNDDDHWHNTLIEIQTIIPLLDGWERELRDKNISM